MRLPVDSADINGILTKSVDVMNELDGKDVS